MYFVAPMPKCMRDAKYMSRGSLKPHLQPPPTPHTQDRMGY